jgi:ADP-ribosylglycohydrolase
VSIRHDAGYREDVYVVSIEHALLSLDGLSVGDAVGATFGEGTATESAAVQISDRILPPAPWHWTDDTHMALSIVEVLAEFEEIDPDALAELFAERYSEDPYRGYAEGATKLLAQIADGGDWRELSPKLFGKGSFGNGGAMRAAPIGGFFCGEPKLAAKQARRSAKITHAHIEGQAGAVAVAVAAAIAGESAQSSARDFLAAILEYLPESEVADGIRLAARIPPENFEDAVDRLGTGWQVSAQDTVPFCLWCAAHNRSSYEDALWLAIAGGGDRDTTCAIVGGIVALSAGGVPEHWLAQREPLPGDFAV